MFFKLGFNIGPKKKVKDAIDIPVAPAETATSFLRGKEIAQKFGFPLVIRPSFTLGGTGASFVHHAGEFEELLTRGLEASPIHEVLIDKALLGAGSLAFSAVHIVDNYKSGQVTSEASRN